MGKDRILAIEDDMGVCRLLRHSLAREDYQVRVAHNGEEGLDEAIKDPPDLFLLDLELPGMDGLAVCQEIKKNPKTRSVPVIILTGKGEESDVVQGLEMGADDYIVKPFSPKILNARVQAVLRRRTQLESPSANDETFQFGSLTVDSRNSAISISGNVVDLSPPEYRFALLLICYLSGENKSSACPQLAEGENPASLLGSEGMALYSENRLGRLLPVFSELIAVGHVDSAVLDSFYGIALFESSPETGRQFLAAAEEKFHKDVDPLGELVVLSHLVFYHVVFDGKEKVAARYLERAETLSKAIFDRLSVFSRVAVAQNLALGRTFLFNDFAGANEYLEIAEALAEDRGLVNLVVLNHLIKITEAYVSGDHEAMAGHLEHCYRFVNHPQVSGLHRALLKVLQLKYLALTGDFACLRQQEKLLKEEYRGILDKVNLPSVQLLLGHLEGLQFEGRYDEVLRLCTESLQNPAIAGNDLVRPLLNGFRAFSAALCDEEKMMHAAVAACQGESGFISNRQTQAKLYCARALALKGKSSEAESILENIIPTARDRGWNLLSLQARTQLLLLKKSGSLSGADAVGSLLSDMQDAGVWYLPSQTADDYLRLYHLAEAAGNGVAYARSLLRKRLSIEVDAEGNLFPILQLTTLGGLKMGLSDGIVVLTEEFSRTQREYIALLAAVPDHRITQEEVQLIFWPDSQPEKARSTLDTMLSRLRRTLKAKFDPYPVKKYLRLQKGVLSLECVVVDAGEVVKGVSRAREMSRRREYWQADLAYARALSRWQGQFMPGSCNADQSAGYASQIQQICLEASLEWSGILMESGQTHRAIEVLSHALTLDRGNESIMKALYRGQMRDGNIAQAHHLLKQFESSLRSEGYSASDVARVLASFKSSPM